MYLHVNAVKVKLNVFHNCWGPKIFTELKITIQICQNKQ